MTATDKKFALPSERQGILLSFAVALAEAYCDLPVDSLPNQPLNLNMIISAHLSGNLSTFVAAITATAKRPPAYNRFITHQNSSPNSHDYVILLASGIQFEIDMIQLSQRMNKSIPARTSDTTAINIAEAFHFNKFNLRLVFDDAELADAIMFGDEGIPNGISQEMPLIIVAAV